MTFGYLWALLSVCVEQLILRIHMMSTWFWHKNRVWHAPSFHHARAALDSASRCPAPPPTLAPVLPILSAQHTLLQVQGCNYSKPVVNCYVSSSRKCSKSAATCLCWINLEAWSCVLELVRVLAVKFAFSWPHDRACPVCERVMCRS
jgi:hypothetical protein